MATRIMRCFRERPCGGARIPVELVLKRLAQDLNVETLLEAYPRLTLADIRACLEYAQGLVEGEVIYPVLSTQ